MNGVVIKKLNKIPDERGCIMHMLRCDDPEFENFGEIYFSEVYPGVIKGWHLHTEMTLNYACIVGDIKLVLYDGKEIQEIYMGEKNYCLVKVPPNIWNGFKGLGTKSAIVANCPTHPHNPNEIKRKSPFTEDIKYDWNIKL